ncbi:TPA: hypothetical protein RH154_002279 [Escherichia coli]|nr:hypothetical protein [Escherichia coli]MCW5986864.1 hypothetical protein [Escherichia coli]HDV3481321.1 hypothetical protein [Escherichia coli]HDV3489966.1 hypothetical protein [Escherichia coli]HDV3494816.1 hypothetical protein [Escherichia coli]
MTTFTKEQLIEMIKRNITVMDRYPDLVTAQMDLEVYKIALASLEAEPVAYIFKHPAGKLFWALTDESNKEQADVIPVYAAAPASVVPDNASEPLAYAYKELTPEIMRNHLAVFERYGIAPNDSSTTIQALRIALDGIERSDAMLQSGNFRENKNSSTNNFREIAETSTNYPVIPSEVLSAIQKVARIRADFDDFDGDRRGIGDCLDEAEQELIVTINKYASQLAVEPVVPAVLERLRTIVADPRALPRRKEWVSGQQYSYVLLENVEAMVDEACHAAMLQGSQPVSQTYNLPELIEGMEVSIDVSTCDADLGNRYFGTVTEALELDTAKNGYILLVQDAEPNFDINGNSPVTPDGWVIVPKKLTAENGAKGVLSGEFSETTFISCPECFGDDDCDTCDGSGRIEIKVPVTWTTIKSIWDKGIEYFAAKPSQEVK